MMTTSQYRWLFGTSLLFIALLLWGWWTNMWFIAGVPVALLTLYFAIYHSPYVYLSLFFLVPLSINIEEYTDGFGLFVPTEPLLFGFLIYFSVASFFKPIFPKTLWKDPLVWALFFYLAWLFLCSITSSHPVASFKFVLVKLWFIVPMVFYGARFFSTKGRIFAALWLFTTGMLIVMLYTIIVHASYSFGEDEGHWVMWPFFKDHTIYGAVVAFNLFLVVILFKSKTSLPLVRFILTTYLIVNLIALYFSYTRAAWLSVIAALIVYVLIYFKVKFRWLLSLGVLLGIVIAFSWTDIQFALAKNNAEHTTEEFGERLQSAANVTTDASNLERLNRWSCAWEMFLERPLVGFGPGTYAFEYARFQDPENLTIISTSFGDLGNAHSEYLGPLAETGLIGLLTVLVIVGLIFYKGITLYIQLPPEEETYKTIVLGLVLALVTYFVHGFLNNYLDTDKAAVPVWASVAILLSIEYRLKKRFTTLD